MRKLITLSDAQNELAEELMAETLQDSVGRLLVFLMVHWKQNAKRPPGRPRSKEDDADNPEDDVCKYQAPDWPHNKTVYSYNDIVNWYEYDPRRGPVPERHTLKLHPKWNGTS